MKPFRVLLLLAPLLLTACGLSDQQKADYSSVARSGVSSAIYDKMVHGDALSLYDIKALARARVSDGVVVRYLRDQETVYLLNTADVESLRAAGVSQSVIDYMLATPHRYPPTIYPAPYDPYWDWPYGGPVWGPPYPYRHWH